MWIRRVGARSLRASAHRRRWVFFSNLLERDGQRAQSPQGQALAVLRPVRGQRQLGPPLEQRVDGDLALDAREGGAEAEVDSPPEGDVTVVRARDVETIGVGELSGITVGRPDE